MKYELAKKLDEAGFPDVPFCKDLDENGMLVRVYYELPPLNKLIDACGDCLSHIKKYNGNWWAVSHCGHPEHEPGGNNIEEAASTAEEAVAKLWLALNVKSPD